jgi:hypothetical protein
MNESNDEKLERLLRGTLGGLPLRRAPDALERSVLTALALRAALPWWRRSFAQWPMAARSAFVLVCAALVVLSLTNGVLQQLGFETSAWIKPVAGLMASVGGAANLAVSLVPPPLLYGVLGVGAALYALLFGLGAVAYRTLYLQPSNLAMTKS